MLSGKEGAGEEAINDTVGRWFSDTQKSWKISALFLVIATDSCKKSSHITCLALTQYFLCKLEAIPSKCICCLKAFWARQKMQHLIKIKLDFYFGKWWVVFFLSVNDNKNKTHLSSNHRTFICQKCNIIVWFKVKKNNIPYTKSDASKYPSILHQWIKFQIKRYYLNLGL